MQRQKHTNVEQKSQTRKSSSRTVLNPQLWPWGEQFQQREADQFVPLLKVPRLVTADRQTKLTRAPEKQQKRVINFKLRVLLTSMTKKP